ncbi:MAG TPA: hypothetical protein VKT33_07960 [Candidatus Angelobacter sp.]|nr:hypothetical protein [Candidatus Angelobacter sp.]
MKTVRRISEAEVIGEFLKAEFYHPEYTRDRERFQDLVYAPDLSNAYENAVRRALLFRRRATMWRELPDEVQWWEIELDPKDLERINVFPRAQWRAISGGDFHALRVAERIRRQIEKGQGGKLLDKIQLLRARLQYDGPRSVAILIGVDETRPMTLLEGNHRFVSSLLLPQEVMLRRLRLVCGFSPRMEKCCWYKTNLPNLSHYLKNRIKHIRDKEADVSRILLGPATRADAAGAAPVKSAADESPRSL